MRILYSIVILTVLMILKANAFSDLNGFGKAQGYSAVLVSFEGQSLNDKALVQVCNHCTYDLRSITLYNSANQEIAFEIEKKFYRTPLHLGELREFALYHLKKTYQELIDLYGIKARFISSKAAVVGTPIYFVDVNGTVQSCEISEFHKSFRFPAPNENTVALDAMIYYGCLSIYGRSGSIIVGVEDNLVYGSNSGGSHPREYNGKVISFATSLHEIYNCLNSDFSLNLELNKCILPKVGRFVPFDGGSFESGWLLH